MREWWQGRLVGFDLETTGVDPHAARIVTAAVALCGGGEPTESRAWLADPGVEIPEEAAKVHGVSTEKAQVDGRPAIEVVREVVELLTVELARGRPLVVFNARYDLTVLERECGRHGVAPLSERQVDLLVVDPFVIDKWLDRYRKGSRKLDAICAHRRASLDGAHEAAHDAIAAARCAYAIGARGEVVRKAWNAEMEAERAALVGEWRQARGDLGRLHAAQKRWAREQALGIADYFRQNGKHAEADGVSVDWPVEPAREPA